MKLVGHFVGDVKNVNSNHLVRLNKNDLNNKSALVKNHRLYTKRRFLEFFFFIHLNNYAFNDKTNCFYPTAYYDFKILK